MKVLYTVTEVAKILKVNRNHVYDLIRAGELKAYKLGSLKIKLSDLEDYINKHEVK